MTYGDEIKIEEVMADPTKFGAPTFSEFSKNPEKFSPKYNEAEQLAVIDNGSQNTRRILKEKSFHVGTQVFKSQEKAVEFCKNYNIPVDQWKVVVEKIPGHWGHEKVIFMDPDEFERRQKW